VRAGEPLLSRAAAWLIAVLLGVSTAAAGASTCNVDFTTHVDGGGECFVIRTFDPASSGAPVARLVVVLQGGVSSGGPANYHFATAGRLAADPRLAGTVVVALVRVGYGDGAGDASTGYNYERTDQYTAGIIDAEAAAIARLKAHYSEPHAYLVGHSGGAATAAVMLGRHPSLADGAVLVSSPCNISEWRRLKRGRPWWRSESPDAYVARISPATRVAVLVGARDDNTPPVLARHYAALLDARHIAGELMELEGADHDGAFRRNEVVDALVWLTAGP